MGKKIISEKGSTEQKDKGVDTRDRVLVVKVDSQSEGIEIGSYGRDIGGREDLRDERER